MNKRPSKTARRVGTRRRFYPGFRITSAADDILQSIPRGQRSQYINEAIEQYAHNPTKRKDEK